jgi:hypothetical protein
MSVRIRGSERNIYGSGTLVERKASGTEGILVGWTVRKDIVRKAYE